MKPRLLSAFLCAALTATPAFAADSLTTVPGAGVMIVPLSVARTHSRRDLIHRPVTDAEPTTIALAWLMDNPNELIEEFIGIVRGRTANSSRTAPRGSSEPDAKPAPAKKRPPQTQTPRNVGRHARGQRRR